MRQHYRICTPALPKREKQRITVLTCVEFLLGNRNRKCTLRLTASENPKMRRENFVQLNIGQRPSLISFNEAEKITNRAMRRDWMPQGMFS